MILSKEGIVNTAMSECRVSFAFSSRDEDRIERETYRQSLTEHGSKGSLVNIFGIFRVSGRSHS